jgi:futalosine hydrolase
MSYTQLPSGPVGHAAALVITPTQFEADLLGPVHSAVIAFGLVDSGIATMRVLEDRRPTMCVLVGIAGTLDPKRLPVGSVVESTGFHCFGIGAGCEPDLETPEEMGLPPECSGIFRPSSYEPSTSFVEGVRLPRCEFLSVAAASGHRGQARMRSARFPEALVEEMEGFSVARAARILGVPFTSVRAISNVAGDRDKENWKVDAAFDALREALDPLRDLLA